MRTILIAALLGVSLAGAAVAQPGLAQTEASWARAPLVNLRGETIGHVTLNETPNGVIVTAAAAALPPGAHGFHLHETGICDAQAGFSSAGGHYAPRGSAHGYRVAEGPHAGDMPNQFVTNSGELRAQVYNPRVRLRVGQAPLLDRDGSALIIHSGTDDYLSQPSGDAGDRIACAAFPAR